MNANTSKDIQSTFLAYLEQDKVTDEEYKKVFGIIFDLVENDGIKVYCFEIVLAAMVEYCVEEKLHWIELYVFCKKHKTLLFTDERERFYWERFSINNNFFAAKTRITNVLNDEESAEFHDIMSIVDDLQKIIIGETND